MLQNDPTVREKLFTMRMSAEESDRLEAVAKHYASNGAGVIRMLVKREHDTITARTRLAEDEAFDAAAAAYKRRCDRTGAAYAQPSKASSHYEGEAYVLHSVRGELARVVFGADGKAKIVDTNE